MVRVAGFGCVIEAMVPIPGAIPVSGAMGPLIRVILSDAVTAGAAGPAGPESFSRMGDVLRYDAPAIGRFDCTSDGVTITPVIGADPLHVSRLLIANALPGVMWLRRAFMLHAAVLMWPGRTSAFAICGPSGSGKSMLAAQCIAAGARLVADDVLALGHGGDALCGAGLPGGVHGQRDAAGGRPFDEVAADQRVAAARLGSIFVLEREVEGAASQFHRLPPLTAMEAVLQQRHRPTVPALFGRQAAVLAQARDIAERVPVWRWHRAEGQVMIDAAERQALDTA